MDKSPLDGIKESNINTLPPIEISPRYREKPIYIGQRGKVSFYTSNENDLFSNSVKPSIEQLALWDSARRKEPIINDGIQKMTRAVKAKLGLYSHPSHPEITEFIRANLDKKLFKWVGDAVNLMLWSGSCNGEIIHEVRKGPNGYKQIWIKDIVFYHPLDVMYILNENSMLTHGEVVPNNPFNTGIWVTCKSSLISKRSIGPSFSGSHVRLPKTKTFHLTLSNESNNPYGTSHLEAATKYHIYKEAFLEMQAAALDRYGTPLIYAVVPMQPTSENIEELDGTTRKKWYHELVTEILGDLRGQQSIVLTQMDKEHPVKLDALTTGNNFSDAFNQAIDLCDDNMMIAMGIPNLILKDKNQGLGTGGAAERQMEAFHLFIGEMYQTVTNAVLEQVVSPLILWNFDPRVYTGAYNSGNFGNKPIRWSENAILITIVDKLKSLGYIDENDRDWVRDIFYVPDNK